LSENTLELGTSGVDEKLKVEQSHDCKGCAYGRDFPCVGWCTVEAMSVVSNKRKATAIAAAQTGGM